MKNLTKIVNILIKVFLIGLFLQFFLHTLFTYKFWRSEGIRNRVRLRKEALIFIFMLITGRILVQKYLLSWEETQKISRKQLLQTSFFRFICWFLILCIVTAFLAVIVQKVSISTYILSAKYDLIWFLIFILWGLLARALPINSKFHKRYENLFKWAIYGGVIWWAIIGLLPSFLKLFGYSRDSFEGTLTGNPPAVYYTQINQWLARNQFLFERPISFGFWLIAFWPLFALTYLRKQSRRTQIWRTIATGAIVLSTYSRAAIWVWIIQTAVLILLLHRKDAKKIIIRIWIPVSILLLWAFFYFRGAFAREHSNTWHIKLLEAGIELGLQKPLFGRGAGYSGPASHQLCLNATTDTRCGTITEINQKYSMDTPGFNPENQYVQIFMEYGILGFIPWIFCFGRLLWQGLKEIRTYLIEVKKWKKADQKELTQILIAIGLGLGLFGLAIEGLVLHSFVDRMIVYPFMLIFWVRYGQRLADHQAFNWEALENPNTPALEKNPWTKSTQWKKSKTKKKNNKKKSKRK